jgi:hypothetical protein
MEPEGDNSVGVCEPLIDVVDTSDEPGDEDDKVVFVEPGDSNGFVRSRPSG